MNYDIKVCQLNKAVRLMERSIKCKRVTVSTPGRITTAIGATKAVSSLVAKAFSQTSPSAAAFRFRAAVK